MRPEPSDLWPVKFWEAREEENMKYLWLLNLLISTGLSGMGFQIFKYSPFISKCSVRLPKWLGNRPRLTNIPFLPASDLGSVCSSSSGEAGVCTLERECRGPGREKLGVCTLFKSACCKGKLYKSNVAFKNVCFTEEVSCHLESTLKSLEFKNPSFPELEVNISIVHANHLD